MADTKATTKTQTATGVGLAAAILIAWGLSQTGIDMPQEVMAALGGVITWIGRTIGERLS